MESFTAQVTIDRLTPAQVRIALREGGGGVVSFMVFVVVVATALYALMPQARAQPAPLVGFLAVALGWAGIGWRAREEYNVDQTTRSLTARHVWLVGQREEQVCAHEISAVRLARRGPDDRFVVELLATNRQVRLRLPRRINTLTARDQSRIGRLVAEHLGVPLHEG
jgi:hypothetical protein